MKPASLGADRTGIVTNRNCWPAVLLLLMGLGGCADSPGRRNPIQDPALQRIIDMHTRARGGASAIERVHSVEMNIQIQEPEFTVQATYRGTRDRRMRIDIYSKGRRVYTEAFDGAHAWQQEASDVHGKLEKPQGEQALLHGIDGPGNLLGLHEAPAHGIALESLPVETANGERFDVVRAKFPDGFSTVYYINRNTHLIDRQLDERALHPDADSTERRIMRRYSDYRDVDGRQIAFQEQQIDLVSGKIIQTVTVVSVTTNPVIAESVFKMP